VARLLRPSPFAGIDRSVAALGWSEQHARCQTFSIDGPLPGMNEMIAAAKGSGGRGAAYARLKLAWTLKVKSEAKRQGLRPVPRATLRFAWFEKDRRRDPDNVASAKKLVLDGLVAAGVLPRDGWSAVLGFSDRWAIDRHLPRVEITIESEPC
jgi:hypothetical protein